MNQLIDQINKDLKQAMLSGDKQLVSVLRGLKSAFQYAAVAQGANSELSEQDTVKVLQKEAKKRADAIELYRRANDEQRASQEEYEKQVIDKYLPELLSESEVAKLVDAAIEKHGGLEPANMGKVIGEVRQSSGGLADGALIAALVKGRLGK